MWRYTLLVCLTVSLASAQNGRSNGHQEHHGHGWDIRLAVPGEPGSDYPTLGNIPRTSFSCAGKAPGYYADLETNCQVFRVCTLGATYGFQSFLCPNGTLFNQAVFVCDWWMNVNCKASAQQINNNNSEKFGSLRLGPQLMKDIKKMLTHPMRNPYDKTAMKSNLVVMQDYKPPFGQPVFPNGALIAGPDRTPNNIYVPAKQIQGFGQNFNGNGISFAASTPDPRYLPAAFNTYQQQQSQAEIYQRQRQNGQYQSGRYQNAPQGTTIPNGHSGQFTQINNNANLQSSRPTQSYNNGNAQYGQRQLSNTRPTPTITTQNAINIQRGQLNQFNSQYTSNQNPSRLNSGKQVDFVPLNQQQYNANQVKQPYTYQQPLLQFSNDINGKAGNEAKQNLALVFSLLADSINVAKGYSNTAQQQASQPTQFQNVNNEDLAQITNQISQLTSSQFSGNNQDFRSAKIISTVPTTISNQGYQYTEPTSQYQVQPLQREQYKVAPSIPTSPQSFARYQSNTNQQNIIPTNSKEIYSGQLYQLPVPDVTNQVYNRQSAKLIQSTNVPQNSPSSFPSNNNRTPSPEVEIIQSQSIPFQSGKLQASPTSEVDSFNSQENFNKFINSNNGISAQLQDKIVGTIKHPLEENKVVTYKKDESFYVYTKLDNTFPQNIQTKGNLIQTNGGQKSAKLIQDNSVPNLVTFQFVPSISYQLEDEKEQQKILNAFQIDEFGSPKQDATLISNVDYTVDHTPAVKQIDRQFNELSNLYAGPSSYSAPQSSVGNLLLRQNNQNARLELEDNTSDNGYAKVTPSRRFSF